MKRLIFGIAALTLLLLAGCIPSLHPFYLKKDLIEDNRIVGTWMGPGEFSFNNKDSAVWVFEQTESDHYLLSYSYDNKEAEFEAHLFMLADQSYLDIFPSDQQNLNVLQTLTAFPGHLLCKIEIKETDIYLQYMDSEYLEMLFENHRIRLKHEKNEQGNILLTAATQELRQFIIKYGQEEDLFTEAEHLRKHHTTE